MNDFNQKAFDHKNIETLGVGDRGVGRLGNEFVIFSYGVNFAPAGAGEGSFGEWWEPESQLETRERRKFVSLSKSGLPSWEFSCSGPSTAAALSRTSLLV